MKSVSETDVRAAKSALRKEMKARRGAIPEGERERQSAAARDGFLASVPYHFAKNLLLYVPVGTELDVLPLVFRALSGGKAVYLPKTFGRGEMRFFRVFDQDALTVTDGDAVWYDENASDGRDTVVVPGLAFDLCGFRLGYGGGYYDRFLARFHGVRAALTFDECVSSEPLPVTKRYDKPVDVLYTAKGVRVVG